MCLSNRLSEQMYFGWEASSSGISWNPRSRFSQPIIFSLLSPNFKKKVPKWQEMIDHSISITTVTMTLTTVTMTLTKVGGDEEGLIELLNYNMELGRMVTTMAKNVFWVRTCSQRWLMFLQWLKRGALSMDLVSMFIVIEFQNKSKRSSQHTLYHHDPGNRPPCVVSPWARCSGNLGGTFFKIGKKTMKKLNCWKICHIEMRIT